MQTSRKITFDGVIVPLRRQVFLSDFWSKSFLHLPGPKGRFASLLPWTELSSITERVEPSRLTLFRDGKRVDSSQFVSIRRGSGTLNSADMMNCLAKGATLIINSVDELLPALRELVEDFEEVLRTRTTVNIYAGWRTQKGFDLHWDSQDTMILQVSGRKHWKVYAPTRLHPLHPDLEETPRPAGEPVWDGILEDGDVLSLPRGWWHVAIPLNEPSLHLTVTVLPPKGADFLQ